MRSMGAWWCDDRLGFAVRTNRQGAVCESSAGTLLAESESVQLSEPQRHRIRTAQHTYIAEWVNLLR